MIVKVIPIMDIEKLHNRIKRAGIRQCELASRVGIDRSLLNKILKGHRPMSEALYNEVERQVDKLTIERIKRLVCHHEH